MNEYDITAAFKSIENELIASMIRNMKHHRAEETMEGIEWSMWQAEQLKDLEKYKRNNQKKYRKQFKNINAQITALLQQARAEGNMQQEIAILNAIKNGFKASKVSSGMTAEFFKLNERKLESLIEATTHDMQQAETAALRMANDQYRKTIFNAQVYANTGAGTYEKAVDMATRDFLAAGLNCIVYANGARHTLSDYADMAIRTASKRAYLHGEGEKRKEWGICTVIVNKRGNPCPKCLPFCGKVLIDDVWSGGPKSGISPDTGKRFPLISKAIEYGLYHPRCKDSHTTYFEGISTADDSWTQEELEKVGQNYQLDQKQQYAARQAEKFDRMAKYSLDEENQKKYGLRANQWKNVRFKTGETDPENYVEEKRKQEFFGTSQDITSTWVSGNEKVGSVSEMMEYTVGGETYKVDGKRVVLDYSKNEKIIGDIIAEKYGKEVKMIPRVTFPQGIQTPDFLIDGERFDLKTFKSSGKNVFYNMIAKKKKQSPNFIFDLTECPLPEEEVERQIKGLYNSHHTRFIEKIVVMKNGEIAKVYRRK